MLKNTRYLTPEQKIVLMNYFKNESNKRNNKKAV